MNLPINLQNTQAITRRHFFGQTGLGFGAIALSKLLAQNGYAAQTQNFKIPAKAKSIIYLHMAGSPSQIDLFENKPALKKYHGKDCPQEYLEGKRFAFIKGTPKMMGPVFDYNQHGESGQWISSLMPGLSSVIDDVLDKIQNEVSSVNFYRANRQFIVSKNAIENIAIYFNGRLIVNILPKPDEKIIVSKAKATDFKNWLSM